MDQWSHEAWSEPREASTKARLREPRGSISQHFWGQTGPPGLGGPQRPQEASGAPAGPTEPTAGRSHRVVVHSRTPMLFWHVHHDKNPSLSLGRILSSCDPLEAGAPPTRAGSRGRRPGPDAMSRSNHNSQRHGHNLRKSPRLVGENPKGAKVLNMTSCCNPRSAPPLWPQQQSALLRHVETQKVLRHHQ